MLRITKTSNFHIAGLGLGLAVLSFQPVALAQIFNPPPIDPDIGSPQDRRGRIRRDDCPAINDATANDVTGIIPDVSHLGGYTTDARPTLWVYLPYTLNTADPNAENPAVQIGNSAKVEIDDENGERREYEAIISGELTEPGIIRLRMPDSIPELEVGTELSWILSVYCGDRDRRVRPLTVRGWITRVEPGTLPDEQIWYDRLTDVGNALRDDPESPEYQQQWADLIQWVEVDGMTDAPIQDCCTLERRE